MYLLVNVHSAYSHPNQTTYIFYRNHTFVAASRLACGLFGCLNITEETDEVFLKVNVPMRKVLLGVFYIVRIEEWFRTYLMLWLIFASVICYCFPKPITYKIEYLFSARVCHATSRDGCAFCNNQKEVCLLLTH